jgi:hypothetical protein
MNFVAKCVSFPSQYLLLIEQFWASIIDIPSEFDTISAGPDHDKYFEASVTIPGIGEIIKAVGSGRNKKDAIKNAAVDACMKLEAMVILKEIC